MSFAILRTQKLKSRQGIRRSTKHAFREQETPNADENLTPENTHIGAQNSDEAMQAINERLPKKIRKNGVMAIEYLITASPEDLNERTRKDQDAYFQDSLKWLKEKHGAENIAYAGIHRDETTPHMYAYVVPIDPKGKLNCRHFLGGAKALNAMQTDFAEQVGKKHHLQRGIEGSKATHQRVKQHYSLINETQASVTVEKERQVVKKSFLTKTMESDNEYQERIIKEVNEQLKITIEKSRVAEQAIKQKKQYQKTAQYLTQKNKDLTHKNNALLEQFKGLDKNDMKEVLKLANSFKIKAENSQKNKTRGFSR